MLLLELSRKDDENEDLLSPRNEPEKEMHFSYLLKKPVGEEILEICKRKHVLDVGCGKGETARILATAGCKVMGIDPKHAEETKMDADSNPLFKPIGFEEFTKSKKWEGVLMFDHSIYAAPKLAEVCRQHPKATVITVQSAKRDPVEQCRLELEQQGRKTRVTKVKLFSVDAPEEQPKESELAKMLEVYEFEKNAPGLFRLDYVVEVMIAGPVEDNKTRQKRARK